MIVYRVNRRRGRLSVILNGEHGIEVKYHPDKDLQDQVDECVKKIKLRIVK